MKKKVAVLLTSLVALIAALAVIPSGASAFAFKGSCGWSTAWPPSWHWSPTYGVYELYQGHDIINGLHYRKFTVYSPVSGLYDSWEIYCG